MKSVGPINWDSEPEEISFTEPKKIRRHIESFCSSPYLYYIIVFMEMFQKINAEIPK